MWDLPGSGVEPLSPAWAGRFFTTEPLRGVQQMNLDGLQPSVHRNANSQMKAQRSASTTGGLRDTPQHRCPAGWYFNDALKLHFQGTYSSEIPGLFVQETMFSLQVTEQTWCEPNQLQEVKEGSKDGAGSLQWVPCKSRAGEANKRSLTSLGTFNPSFRGPSTEVCSQALFYNK